MGPEAAGAVLACVVIFLMAVRVAGGTVRTVSGMFRAPDLGWPSGVQEDDDLHWAWAAGSTAAAGARVAEPELHELEGIAIGLEVQPLMSSWRR